MDIISHIKKATQQSLRENYQFNIQQKDILVTGTKPEFEGDYTVVLFSFVKRLKKSLEIIGDELGIILTKQYPDLFSGLGSTSIFMIPRTGSNSFCQLPEQFPDYPDTIDTLPHPRIPFAKGPLRIPQPVCDQQLAFLRFCNL